MPKILGLALLALVLASPLLAAAPLPAAQPAANPATIAAAAPSAPGFSVPAATPAAPQLPDFLAPRTDVIICPQNPPNCCAYRCTGSCCICTRVGVGCGNN